VRVRFSGDNTEPTGGNDAVHIHTRFYAWIDTYWIEENPVPDDAASLAAFDLSALIPQFKQFEATDPRAKLPIQGNTLEAQYFLNQLVFGRERTCLVSANAPDLDQIGRIRRIVVLPQNELVQAAAELTQVHEERLQTLVLFGPSAGHVISLTGYDAAADTFAYSDPWRGWTLLAKYVPDPSAVARVPRTIREWTIRRDALSPMLYAVLADTEQWTAHLHGTTAPRRAQPKVAPADWTLDQTKAVVAAILRLEALGLLDRETIAWFWLVTDRGVLFQTRRHEHVTLLDQLVRFGQNVRGTANEQNFLDALQRLAMPGLIDQGRGSLLSSKTLSSPAFARLANSSIVQAARWMHAAGDDTSAVRWLRRIKYTGVGVYGLAFVCEAGELLTEYGAVDAALEMYLAPAPDDGDDIDPVWAYTLGQRLTALQRTDEATRWYEQALASGHPEAAGRAAFNLSALALAGGRPNVALTWLQSGLAVASQPVRGQLRLAIAVAAEQAGDVGRARAEFDALATDEDLTIRTMAMNGRSELETRQGAMDVAREWHERALALRTASVRALPKEAAGGAQQASDSRRQTAADAFSLGNLLAGQDDTTGAQTAYQKAIDSRHTDYAPAARVKLGALLAGQGDAAGAQAAYQKAIDSGHPEHAPDAAVNLGALLAGQGDTAGARAAYQKAIDSRHSRYARQAAAGLESLPVE
jgi:tetratricopeptide (TPR) repeat protein